MCLPQHRVCPCRAGFCPELREIRPTQPTLHRQIRKLDPGKLPVRLAVEPFRRGLKQSNGQIQDVTRTTNYGLTVADWTFMRRDEAISGRQFIERFREQLA